MTYPNKEWTDEECAEGLLEALFNMGTEATKEIMMLVMKFKDHAKVMEFVEKEYLRQRKREIPDDIRDGLARAVEACLRGLPSFLEKKKRSYN